MRKKFDFCEKNLKKAETLVVFRKQRGKISDFFISEPKILVFYGFLGVLPFLSLNLIEKICSFRIV